MRILVVAPQVPWPAHQGTALRNANIVGWLAARHSVTLLAFGDPATAPALGAEHGIDVVAVPPPPPRSLATRWVDLVTTPTPDLARRLGSAEMDAAIARLARARATGGGTPLPPFDVVQIEGLEMAPHGLAAHAALALAQGRRPRLVYDGHNAEWVLQARARRADVRRPRGWPGAAYSAIQAHKLRAYERRLLATADAVVAVSDADAAVFRALAPEARMACVPNGVDTDVYTPSDPTAVDATLCVFTGKMDFRPNVDAMAWFCGQVWPRVRAACPGARLAIVGRDPVARVAALADPEAGITVTGAVPDVRPWIARAGVVVAPLRVGGGTRLKVLEAMAMAKAVAATTLGVEGLDVHDGQEVALGDTPGALAGAIVGLIDDPDRRARMGEAARTRAVERYRWAVLMPVMEGLYTA